jgi:hypothetical protein
MSWRVASVLTTFFLAFAASVWAEDPVAYITEIKRGGDDAVFVRLATGDGQFQLARPLLALRRGDEIRVSGNGQVVLLYQAGSGTRKIGRSDSPFTIGPAPMPTNGPLRVLVSAIGELALKQGPSIKQPLVVRGTEVVLVSPRYRLLPGPLVFEWTSDGVPRQAIRLTGLGGDLVWESRNVLSSPVSYPASAPRLTAGDKYTWEVESSGSAVRSAWFQILTDDESRRIQQELASLNADTREGYSRGTIPLMRAALLIDKELYVDARRELTAAVAINPAEPSYPMLLAYVYQRIGLTQQAFEACHRALVLAGVVSVTRSSSPPSQCGGDLAVNVPTR